MDEVDNIEFTFDLLAGMDHELDMAIAAGTEDEWLSGNVMTFGWLIGDLESKGYTMADIQDEINRRHDDERGMSTVIEFK